MTIRAIEAPSSLCIISIKYKREIDDFAGQTETYMQANRKTPTMANFLLLVV